MTRVFSLASRLQDNFGVLLLVAQDGCRFSGVASAMPTQYGWGFAATSAADRYDRMCEWCNSLEPALDTPETIRSQSIFVICVARSAMRITMMTMATSSGSRLRSCCLRSGTASSSASLGFSNARWTPSRNFPYRRRLDDVLWREVGADFSHTLEDESNNVLVETLKVSGTSRG